MYKRITKCRLCGNTDLVDIVDLGNQVLDGVFPRDIREDVDSAPLELVKCNESTDNEKCGLVQLKHTYCFNKDYWEKYGYRSSINETMKRHLEEKVGRIIKTADPDPGDCILDIGSNDGTLLKAYPQKGLMLIGVDPGGRTFRKYYPDNIHLIDDYFSSEIMKKILGKRKVKAVTSIAVIYDLEAPAEFAKQVHDILSDDGIWVFEQSYLPSMLQQNAYDTICHEHLAYYRLSQIKWMLDRTGFKIIDIELNAINGGSFSVTAAKTHSVFNEKSAYMAELIAMEQKDGLQTLAPYEKFSNRIYAHREQLCKIIHDIRAGGELIIGYGASTKGNVLLQFCGFNSNDISYIAEVNEDKFGCYTPGTKIPIISEEKAHVLNPGYFLVFPWHFRDNFLKKEEKYLSQGGKLLFPLPKISIV
ncbi:MAG: class I SAM-dependent methyltransferase [Elusimicrobiota bacterium]